MSLPDFNYVIEDVEVLGEIKKQLIIFIMRKEAKIQYIVDKCPYDIGTFHAVIMRVKFDPTKDIVIPKEEDAQITTQESNRPCTLNFTNIFNAILLTNITIDIPEIFNIKIKLSLLDNITKPQDSLMNLKSLTLNNCILEDGFNISNKKDLVLEFNSCKIYKEFFIESVNKKRNDNLFVTLNGCMLIDIYKLIVNHCASLNIVGLNVQCGDRNETTMLPLLVSFNDIIQCNITNIKLTNMWNEMTITTCDNLLINNIRFSHKDKTKPIPTLLNISKSKIVKLIQVYGNGLFVYECDDVVISEHVVNSTICNDAEYGLRCIDIREKLALSRLMYKDGGCGTGVNLTAITAKSSLSYAEIKDTKTAIKLMLIDGTISIIESKISNNKKGIEMVDSKGKLNIASNSEIFDNEVNIILKTVSTFAMLNSHCTNINNIQTKPNFAINDIELKDVNFIRLSECVLDRVKLSITDSFDVELNANVVLDAIVHVDKGIDLKYTYNNFTQSDIKTDPTKHALNISNLEKFIATGNTCITHPFMIYSVDMVDIRSNDLHTGILLEGCGGIVWSKLNINTIGKASEKKYKYGVFMKDCKGIDVSTNTFDIPSQGNAITLANSFFNTLMDNVFLNEKNRVVLDKAPVNLNHISVDINSANIPLIRSTNMFREAMFIYDRGYYNTMVNNGELPVVEKEEDLQALNSNIISILDPSNEFAVRFIRKVNKLIDKSFNDYMKALSTGE